ncbi:LLM class F420-dependent oxidoreductase [Mycobacterium antarcticum]|nr:LLM class F420-dependent oxidoreductase [Mycolicibacterium sp. TUM20985]
MVPYAPIMSTSPPPLLDELGFCMLLGGSDQTRDLIAENRKAEQLGIGHAWISERWGTKEAATVCGAAGAVTERIHIHTGVTNHNIRHPEVNAAFIATMWRLTGGRFTLGIGRGGTMAHRAFGIPAATNAQMEEFATVMRRMLRGETLVGYDGPLGTYPALRLLQSGFSEEVPLGIAGLGPNTLRVGGRAYDEVLLFTFFSDEALTRSVQTVKTAAEQAGRDPDDVVIWSCLATVSDGVPYEDRMMKTVGRLAAYLQAIGDTLVAVNGWDPLYLSRFREDPLVRSYSEGGVRPMDTPGTPVEHLERVAEIIPNEWLTTAAVGTPEQCAREIRRQMELGADKVFMHASTPWELEPVVAAYRAANP